MFEDRSRHSLDCSASTLHQVVASSSVDVDVHKPGCDNLSAQLDHARGARNFDCLTRVHGADHAVFNKDDSVLDCIQRSEDLVGGEREKRHRNVTMRLLAYGIKADQECY